MTQRNDQRFSSSHTATRASPCSQSRRCRPIALTASTWTGKSTSSAALGAASLLPSLPRTAIRRSARSSRAAGCNPARAFAAFDAPSALRRLRWPTLDQVIGAHVITRLQPQHPPRTRSLEQQTTADDPAVGQRARNSSALSSRSLISPGLIPLGWRAQCQWRRAQGQRRRA